MSELDRDAQAIIARARRSEGPSAEDRERLRARLEPIWEAYRAQQQPYGSGVEQVGGKTHGSWGRGTSWLHTVLLSALVLWSPQAAPELRSPSPRAPEAAPARVQSMGLEHADRADQQPRAAEGALGERSSTELGALDPGLAPERAISPAQREPTQVTSPPPPHAAADARARAGRADVAARVTAGTAPRSAGSVSRPDPKLARAATVEPAPAEHAPADRRADREALEIASHERASQAAEDRHGKAELSEPREQGPVRRDPGFAPQAIDDELSWLAAAQQALREGRAEQALRLVQEHAFRFPRGALAPERIAVQALALCALDRRSAARAVLADLARTAPGSPLLRGVQRKCGDGL